MLNHAGYQTDAHFDMFSLEFHFHLYLIVKGVNDKKLDKKIKDPSS